MVFSKTLPAAGWPGSRIPRGDLAEAGHFPDGIAIHVYRPISTTG